MRRSEDCRVTADQPADLEVLAAWAPELADTFVALSCDIALVIDADGRVASLAQRESQPIAPPSWIGSAWVDTVGPDSHAKIAQMLAEVGATGQAGRREINHPAAIGGAAPVAYRAARLGVHGPTLAVGHDLRAQAVLQQRFVAAQEALERSYWNAHRHLHGSADEPAPATPDENDKLAATPGGSAVAEPHDDADNELVHAIGRLVERVGHDELPGLLRTARRLAERHFLARAAQRAGGLDALARSLDFNPRTPAGRRKIRPTS